MAAIDKTLKKLISKKLAGFFIATLLLIYGYIEADHWAVFSSVWVGGQAVIDGVLKRFNNG